MERVLSLRAVERAECFCNVWIALSFIHVSCQVRMNQLELGRRSTAVRVIGSIIRVGGSQKSEFFLFSIRPDASQHNERLDLVRRCQSATGPRARPVHLILSAMGGFALKRSDSQVAAASRPGNCSLTSRRLIMTQAPLLSLTRR